MSTSSAPFPGLLTGLLGALAVASIAPSPIASEAPEAPSAAPRAGNPMPPPTENWLGEGAESANKARRKAFYASIHRAAPGVDWKAIERENGRMQLEKRKKLKI